MSNKCKICGGKDLRVFAHTAKCGQCGVLLYYPYPEKETSLGDEATFRWYSRSSFFNHNNFTSMLRFAMDESFKGRPLDILDYGGGGGQFALVCKSHFPESTIYIADIFDDALLEHWRPLNVQIPFDDFDQDERRFDFIFLNDVFEHVSDPTTLLKQLAGKLKDGGNIFLDTPKQFWIYPLTKMFSRLLYAKVLKGTVSKFHLQIWSNTSFQMVIEKSGLSIRQYDEKTEYTMPAEFYLDNMRIHNPVIRYLGRLFYRNARWLAKNKIFCVLSVNKQGGRRRAEQYRRSGAIKIGNHGEHQEH